MLRREGAGESLDLQPIREFIGRLVQTSGRHTEHGLGDPIQGHACAQGSHKKLICRYGFPHECSCRACGVRLQKGDREGQWFARFPRNDQLCISFEPHLLLADAGNIDWRPCLNLWATIEYVTKYATKAPKGSKHLADTLNAAVDEVLKYSSEEPGVYLLQRALQKVFARTLGGRDYSMFESVFLGLGLPQVFELMPTVSLNTYGYRVLKPASVTAKQEYHESVVYDSKVDKFDKRLELLRLNGCGANHDIRPDELRDLSLYEFTWKYYVCRGKIFRNTKDVAIMVTPSFSADCACTTHARHEMYARTCVVAFWRLIGRERRLRLFREAVVDGRMLPVSCLLYTSPSPRD